MISVWPKFYRGTANFEALEAGGASTSSNLVEGKQDWLKNVFTPTTRSARGARAFWSQIRRAVHEGSTPGGWTSASWRRSKAVPDAAAQVEATRHT